jgi:NAD(P)-dependent dehydrogenase (short-subunit alcohol dehydrogenase family)
MTDKLRGRVAVVTGGGGGIGKAVALALADEGASIVVNDIGVNAEGEKLADRTVAEVQKSGGAAVANGDDVSSLEGASRIIAAGADNFGRVDILVNCAGNYRKVPLLEMKEDDWDSQIAVHLKGHFACTLAAVPEMAKQGAGRIVNISSRGAFMSAAGGVAYAAAKAGIIGATSSLARELAEMNITVNALLPSAETTLFPGTQPRGAGFPNAISLDPAYIAPVIAYLCTDDAREITGQFIYVSGGDVCFYDNPLQPRIFVRKSGKWTLDELAETLPPLATPAAATPF